MRFTVTTDSSNSIAFQNTFGRATLGCSLQAFIITLRFANQALVIVTEKYVKGFSVKISTWALSSLKITYGQFGSTNSDGNESTSFRNVKSIGIRDEKTDPFSSSVLFCVLSKFFCSVLVLFCSVKFEIFVFCSVLCSNFEFYG